ncbi:MAG TPA: hypothetical protein VG034_26750, partial [Acidimicrobiia bacterium]|nr:hypothetical protein [Acidimicrobiia bacterium]
PTVVDGGVGPAGPAAAARLPVVAAAEPDGPAAEGWAGAADAERPPVVAAGPERVVGEEPAAAVVAVVPVAAGTPTAAPVATVVAVGPALGAATVSGPPTPAF